LLAAAAAVISVAGVSFMCCNQHNDDDLRVALLMNSRVMKIVMQFAGFSSETSPSLLLAATADRNQLKFRKA